MSQPVYVTNDQMHALEQRLTQAIAALGVRHGEEFVEINKRLDSLDKRLDKIEQMLERISGQLTPKK